MNIGAPVAAIDPDSDLLTYSLGGPDEEFFDLAASSGQLLTKTALDYESKSSYSVTVSVRDSKDDEGNPDTTTDSTIAVTINVTTTTTATATATATTSSGNRGGGGGRGRATQTTDTNANTEPNAYGDTNPNRTAVLRPDCRGVQHDRHGGTRWHYPGP